MSGQIRSYRVFVLLFLFSIIYVTSNAQDRYWVNGSGSWNDRSHWAEKSGGQGGAEIPTKNNDVIIDHNSFSQPGQYIEIKGQATCDNLLWKATSHKPAIKSRSFLFKKWTNSSLNVYGSLQLPEEMVNKYYGNIILKSGHDNNTINIKPKLHSDLIFNGKNGEWALKEKLHTTGKIQLKRGSLNTNDQDIVSEVFVGSGEYKRAMELGKSNIIVEKWDFENSENLYFNAEQSKILFKNEKTPDNLKLGNLNYNSFSSYYTKSGAKASVILDTAFTDSVLCNGGSTGNIHMLASGGSGDYRYELEQGGSLIEFIETTADSIAFTDYSAGTYDIFVRDQDNLSDWEGRSITIYEPEPLIIDSVECIQALDCYNGSGAKLKAYISGGTEPYNYTWEVNGTVESDSSVVTGISRDDVIAIEVTDANGCGPSSDNTIFDEFEYGDSIPSEISMSVDNVISSCALNDDGEIELNATGGTGEKDFRIVSTSSNDTTPSPPSWDEDGIFTGLAPDTYETFAIDENGCTVQGPDATVDSITQTNITSEPIDNSACEGTQTKFGVDAEGESLSYTWQTSNDGTDGSWGNISGSDVDSLTIDPVSDSDELYYRVHITGDCGEDTSNAVFLTVSDTVTITDDPSPVTVCEGENATFNVTATGEAPLEYQWSTNAGGCG